VLVNVPMPGDTFNYAPVVYWYGWDDDGLLSGFQIRDDTTQAAIDAAHYGDLLSYARNLPDYAWTDTTVTQAKIYLLSAEGDTSEHIFMVRSVDNLGALSEEIAFRVFFRTNNAPNPPKLKWALDDSSDYVTHRTLSDTILWADTLSSYYPGLQILWQGKDSLDDREFNIIPLEFSYLMVNTDSLDTVVFSYYDTDSVFKEEKRWSDWSPLTQLTFYGNVHRSYGGLKTGHYTFSLRVRDDGYTEATDIATLDFYAIKPDFEKQLLIVDENKPLVNRADSLQGGRSDQDIMNFYRAVVPEAMSMAYEYAPYFVSDTTVDWYLENKDGRNRIPYSLITKYKLIWVIDDDSPTNNNWVPYLSVVAKLKVYARYLDVGGGLMISGRRLFQGSYAMSGAPVQLSGDIDHPLRFFINYFNLTDVYARSYSAAQPLNIDFVGATTTIPDLPALKIDTSIVCNLRWGGRTYCALPDIDRFGRINDNASSSYTSYTLYNYKSSTADSSYNANDVDCHIYASTPSVAYLAPDSGDTRILEVDTVYNATKRVPGEVMWVDRGGQPGTPWYGWRIVVSTPAGAGAWEESDTLMVDYTYIPISENHDQPIATNFAGTSYIQTFDFNANSYRITWDVLFRTSLFTFPFSFIDTTRDVNGINPVAQVLAYQIVTFNEPRHGEFRGGGQ
jgi:hypothetical protein